MSRQIMEVLFVVAFLSLPVAVIVGLLFGVVATALKGRKARKPFAKPATSAVSNPT